MDSAGSDILPEIQLERLMRTIYLTALTVLLLTPALALDGDCSRMQLQFEEAKQNLIIASYGVQTCILTNSGFDDCSAALDYFDLSEMQWRETTDQLRKTCSRKPF